MTSEKVKTAGICALVFLLAATTARGKANYYKSVTELNGDNKNRHRMNQDFIYGNYADPGTDKDKFVFSVKLSKPDGSYENEKEIFSVGGKVFNIQEKDEDRDGDKDIVFSCFEGKEGRFYRIIREYIAENDGKGNFSQPRVIYERKAIR